MTENFWTDKYPEGVAAEIDPDQYPNVQAVLKQSCALGLASLTALPRP